MSDVPIVDCSAMVKERKRLLKGELDQDFEENFEPISTSIYMLRGLILIESISFSLLSSQSGAFRSGVNPLAYSRFVGLHFTGTKTKISKQNISASLKSNSWGYSSQEIPAGVFADPRRKLNSTVIHLERHYNDTELPPLYTRKESLPQT